MRDRRPNSGDETETRTETAAISRARGLREAHPVTRSPSASFVLLRRAAARTFIKRTDRDMGICFADRAGDDESIHERSLSSVASSACSISKTVVLFWLLLNVN